MITGSEAAVARATAAVFVDGERAGSAVLVDPRHLVTAAHVLQRPGLATRAEVSIERIELEFPGLGRGGQPGRATASRVDLGPADAGVDMAVLDLGEDPPGWLPAPVPVWPAARPPPTVKVFGYPLAERPLNGVWRQFAVTGPATPGTRQLEWTGDVGTFPGHSGGPVIDADSHALAGILVEGSERGRFDRFVPVTLIAHVWPRLPRPWLITGNSPGEARSHFTRRARGQRSAARGGDLFRGRRVALDRIREWMTADEPPGRPLVVSGQPGAGKSAVLARAALALETEHHRLGLAFHAHAATITDLLTALADLTGVNDRDSAGGLLGALGDHGGGPWLVMVDALDEVATITDRRQIAELLMKLAARPGLRVAVATRPLAAGGNDRDRYGPEALLPALGVTSPGSASLVDLDTDRYFGAAGVRDYAAALLTQLGADPGSPPGGGWSRYRADSQVRDRVAALVAGRADRNYLVAALAADRLSRDAAVDPAAPGFNPGVIPASVGEALDKYLDGLAPRQRVRVRGLLTALAYARGAGLDDQMWLAFATGLGYHVGVEDLDELRDSTAVDYLLQTTRTADRRPVTRLFHQALTDELLYRRDRPGDESLLVDVLLGEATRTGWAAAYLRRHAADHAAAAGRLDQLLDDPHYLLAAEPARLVPHLGSAHSTTGRAAAIVYRQAAHDLTGLDPPERASQLELYARRLGHHTLANRIADAAPNRPWHTRWSHGRDVTDHQTLTGHTKGVTAAAVGALPDGTPVAVSGSHDGTVRVWRLADGTPVGEPLTGHTDSVRAVAAGALPDGTPVVVSGSWDGTVRVWRLPDGPLVGDALTGHTGSVTAVAVGALPDGTPVAVSGSEDRTVRVWQLADGAPVGEPLTGHTDSVRAVAVGVWVGVRRRRLRRRLLPVRRDPILPDGTPVVISGSEDRTVRVWRLADGAPVRYPYTYSSYTNWRSAFIDAALYVSALAIAVGTLPDGTPVVVSGGWDGTVEVWRLADGTPVGEPLTGHTDSVLAVAAGTLPDGTPVAVSGGDVEDPTVRVWRLADGTPVGQPLTGHTGSVTAVAVGALPDGTPVAVSGGRDAYGRRGGGEDRTVRVWRLADGTPVGQPLTGHTGSVTAVAVGALPDGTPVAVSGGEDRTVRVWRLADGTPVGEPLTGHTGSVTAVAVGALPDGTPVVVSGSEDRTVRVWWLADGSPAGPPLRLPAAVGAIAVQGDLVITTAYTDIAVHQPAFLHPWH